MLCRNVMNQLLNEDRLTYTGASKQTDLSTLCIGARRSITLIPVSRISATGLCSSNDGGSCG